MKKILIIFAAIIITSILSCSVMACAPGCGHNDLSNEFILETYLEKYKNNEFYFDIDGYEPIADDNKIYSMKAVTVGKVCDKIYHPVIIEGLPCYQSEEGQLYYGGHRIIVNNMGTLDKEIDGCLITTAPNRAKYLINGKFVVYHWGNEYCISATSLPFYSEYIIGRYKTEYKTGNFIKEAGNNVINSSWDKVYYPILIDSKIAYQTYNGELYYDNELIVSDIGTLDQWVPGIRIAKGKNFSIWYDYNTEIITYYSWGKVLFSVNSSYLF